MFQTTNQVIFVEKSDFRRLSNAEFPPKNKFASQLNSLDMFPSSWHRHETPADGVRNTICIADFALFANTGDQSSTIILSVFGQDSMDSGKNPECTPPCLEAKGLVETKAALAEAALTGLWQVAVLVLLGNQVFSDFFANSQGLLR